MQKTKIEWCDMTWNPVTGCLHNCEYCYARKMAARFDASFFFPDKWLDAPWKEVSQYSIGDRIYNRAFWPSFRKVRLDEPQRTKKPQNIFVCSMADLFGEWVPDEWIQAVFEACEKAPQHRYLFLTKNPKRYFELAQKSKLPVHENWWYGTTAPTDDAGIFYSEQHNTFLSIEPMLTEFDFERINDGLACRQDWVIIGAETGNRKDKVIPKREWIERIVQACRDSGVPVFLKDNLASIWGEPLTQECPW